MSKKIFKEGLKVLKTLKTTDIELSELQVYLTSDEGVILEFCIGYDDDGELRKTCDTHDSIEDLQELREDSEDEFCENTLLN